LLRSNDKGHVMRAPRATIAGALNSRV